MNAWLGRQGQQLLLSIREAARLTAPMLLIVALVWLALCVASFFAGPTYYDISVPMQIDFCWFGNERGVDYGWVEAARNIMPAEPEVMIIPLLVAAFIAGLVSKLALHLWRRARANLGKGRLAKALACLHEAHEKARAAYAVLADFLKIVASIEALIVLALNSLAENSRKAFDFQRVVLPRFNEDIVFFRLGSATAS